MDINFNNEFYNELIKNGYSKKEALKAIKSSNHKWKAFKYLDDIFAGMTDLPESDEEVKEVAYDFLSEAFGEDFFDNSLEEVIDDWVAKR